MSISKRGDHLYANGMGNTIKDVVAMIGDQIKAFSEGRVLYEKIVNCLPVFDSDLFSITINKGRSVTEADPHSLSFGVAAQELKLRIQSLVFALEVRRAGYLSRDASGAEREHWLRSVNHSIQMAKQFAVLGVDTFFDSVVDEDVRQQLDKNGSGTASKQQLKEADAAMRECRKAIKAAIQGIDVSRPSLFSWMSK
ncbi:conserved hypothetical protein [Burkholderia sp. 8Y]|uniref:hypothetical protein n=1 Tax=Burkholderia sp. 8Y TaxID=2653133 RepID=UPI0012F1AA7E|nr:hypothetical protein [Burkholderia sp. 8Y]VXC88441.1 conserved hypothetical protein [Burkholderia sp. 8Y]